MKTPSQRILPNSQIALLMWPGGPSQAEGHKARGSARGRSPPSARISGVSIARGDAETDEPEDRRTKRNLSDLQ